MSPPRRLLLATLVVVLTSRSARADAPLEPAPAPHGDRVRWYALPSLAWDTDDLLGVGGRAELAFVETGIDPYDYAFTLQAYVAQSGFQHHGFTFDRVGFGPERRLRLTMSLAWRQWRNDGYYGIGNATTRERAYVDDFASDDPRRKRYRYSLFQPFLYGTLRVTLAQAWDVFVATNLKWSRIEAYEGSLLEEQEPFGMAGGSNAQLILGIVYDSRFPEITPDGGIFAELSGRVSPPIPNGDGAYGGGFATLRAFHLLTPGLVVAARAMVEVLEGDVPFYEMVHWGGSIPTPGFGGYLTLRGLTFGRWRAPGKALANFELRVDLAQHTVFGDPVRWQLVPYGDLGLVFFVHDGPEVPAPKPFPLHPSAGLGVHVVYQEVFVLRIDGGYGIDPVREPDGGVTNERTFGLYVVAGQMF